MSFSESGDDGFDRLNATKAKLASQDPQQWHEHTSNTSLSYRLVPELRRTVQPELCTVAWTKMYELLSAFPALLPRLNLLTRPISTLHLCEAPGAFVCALNHYLRAKATGASNWSWVASSLNPAHAANAAKGSAMIAADRFLRATAGNWYCLGWSCCWLTVRLTGAMAPTEAATSCYLRQCALSGSETPPNLLTWLLLMAAWIRSRTRRIRRLYSTG
jgi:hypothetical protein